MKTKPSHVSHYLLEGAAVLLLLLLGVALGTLHVTLPPPTIRQELPRRKRPSRDRSRRPSEETTQDESGLTQIFQFWRRPSFRAAIKGKLSRSLITAWVQRSGMSASRSGNAR
jgi:hypothetical protein